MHSTLVRILSFTSGGQGDLRFGWVIFSGTCPEALCQGAKKTMGIAPTMKCFLQIKIRGRRQLNYDILKQSVLQELRDPLDGPRQIPEFNPHFITRNKDHQLETVTQIKRYKLVFNKWAVIPNTAVSYSFGYQSTHEDTIAWFKGVQEQLQATRQVEE